MRQGFVYWYEEVNRKCLWSWLLTVQPNSYLCICCW